MRVILTMMLVAIATRSLQAEQIRLKNGDVIFASVVSLDEKTLKLKSENFGEVSVDRESVVEIRFAEAVGSSWRSVRPGPHWPGPHLSQPPQRAVFVPGHAPATQPTIPVPSPATGPSPYLPPASGYNPAPIPSPSTVPSDAAAPARTRPLPSSLLEPPPASLYPWLQSEIKKLLSDKNLDAARKRAQEMVAELESLKAGKQTAEAEGMLDEYLRLLREFVSGKPSP